MQEFNILEEAGISQRKKRERKGEITEEDRRREEKLGFSFYDGTREKGFGGYYYDGRWRKVAEVIKKRYNLNENSKVLIDRCHKGFLVFDLKKLIPGITVYGIHPSEYPINHAMEGYGRWALINGIENNKDPKTIEEEARNEILPFLLKAENLNLPFKDKYFDCVISIENVCAFYDSRTVLRELIRVSKDSGKNSYIQNDSWTNNDEEEKLRGWTLLCKTFIDVNDWAKMMKEEGFEGDYGFTIIE